jgi:hypothetical protein
MEITSFNIKVIAFFAVIVLWKFVVMDIGFSSVKVTLRVIKTLVPEVL